MNTQRIISLLLLVFGEAVIITAFILFRGDTANNIFVLNLVISLFIFVLLSLNYGAPWIHLKDQSQKQISALGINWVATSGYTTAAILTMLICNVVLKVSFDIQLIIQCVWLLFLLSGMSASRYASGKVQSVYVQEAQNRQGIREMKKAMEQLKDRIVDVDDLPVSFIERIDGFEKDLHFISPSDHQDAYELERSFVEIIDKIKFAVSDFSMNKDQIETDLKRLDRIHQKIKNIHSN